MPSRTVDVPNPSVSAVAFIAGLGTSPRWTVGELRTAGELFVMGGTTTEVIASEGKERRLTTGKQTMNWETAFRESDRVLTKLRAQLAFTASRE
jgi:hypothetical protein